MFLTKPFPLWLQNLNTIVGFLGFFITIQTLRTTYSVKKQLGDKYEIQKFNQNFNQIIAQIDSHLSSIQQDQIYVNDRSNFYTRKISNFVVNVESSYTFLPYRCTHQLNAIKRLASQQIVSSEDWNCIAEHFIKLKNFLEKEHSLHD